MEKELHLIKSKTLKDHRLCSPCSHVFTRKKITTCIYCNEQMEYCPQCTPTLPLLCSKCEIHDYIVYRDLDSHPFNNLPLIDRLKTVKQDFEKVLDYLKFQIDEDKYLERELAEKNSAK